MDPAEGTTPDVPRKRPKDQARGRAKETLFRVAARNQIQLIAIADNKANLIIGMNVLLISVIIAFFGSGITLSGVEAIKTLSVAVPFGILLVSCLISGVFATTSARPELISNPDPSSKSILFFQNFYHKTLDQYKEEFRDVLKSRTETYDQMIIDMYHNGLVLHHKYRQLIYSYNVFMGGLILSVLSFFLFAVVL